MLKKWAVMILVLSSNVLFAQTYDFNDSCLKAYQQIFELKFDAAQATLDAEKTAQPDNLIPIFLENYIDFLSLYISEEDEMYSERVANKEMRLDALKQGDKSSPYFLYAQAEIHMQWAFSRIKFGQYIKAFLEIRKAYKLLQQNDEKFPEFKPNKKSLGVLHTLLGAIPDKYKTGAKILGMKGSIKQGMEELASVIKDDEFVFKDEALIMYALLQLHLNKNESEAWNIINDTSLKPSKNLTHCFAASSIAIYTGKNDKAIELLSNRPQGKDYFPFPFLDFWLGNTKLNRLDDDADVYLKKYIAEYKGKNYIKEAHRKLSWFYLLKGNYSSYNYHLQMAMLDGEATSDEDKSALKEARAGIKPHLGLLKARLLFDGAYYDKALATMHEIEKSSLKTKEEKVEFNYRMARIQDEIKNYAQAKTAYKQTIEEGSDLKLFYAPNACIKLGNIFEKEGNATEATKFYKMALDFNGHDYENSIDAEAKAGLNRLK